ncbi:MAG: serine/threonine-protein kinase [Acidimicrobiales bacterium]
MPLDQTCPVDGWGQPAGLLAGRYELDESLGQGGMGVVRGGRDTRLDRPVAVKLLRPEVAGDAKARARFESEARAAAKLAHPNVVAVFDSGEEEGLPFIVMERLSGRTLRDVLASGPLSGGAAALVARQVLAALDAAHAAGLIHRDIKPGNILDAARPNAGDARARGAATAPGAWKVADFGIAKSLEPIGEDHTATGLLIGTPKYLAPERLSGGTATVSGDLYALGVVLYEALAGRAPFEAGRPEEWASVVSTTEPAPIGSLRPDVEPVLCAAIDRCLAKDPAERFASARDMTAAITGVPAGASAEATVPLSATDHTEVLPAGDAGSLAAAPVAGTSRWARHRRTIGAAVAGALAVVVLVVIVSLVATSNPSNPTTTTVPATTGAPGATAPAPTTPGAGATTPGAGATGPGATGPGATGSLPPGLNRALQKLQSEVHG